MMTDVCVINETINFLFEWILRKFYGRYGDLIQQYEVSLYWHSDPWPGTVTSQMIKLSSNSMTLRPSLTFIELWVVSMEHLQRVWHASRTRLHFRTPGSVPFIWLAYTPIVKTSFTDLAVSILDFSPWISLGTFSILLQARVIFAVISTFFFCFSSSLFTLLSHFLLVFCGTGFTASLVMLYFP